MKKEDGVSIMRVWFSNHLTTPVNFTDFYGRHQKSLGSLLQILLEARQDKREKSRPSAHTLLKPK